MYVLREDITFESTGKTFEFRGNDLKNITSIYLTSSDLTFTLAELQDVDSMFSKMQDGDLFPIHDIHELSTEHKPSNYTESKQDFTYRSYRGKDIFKIKYDLRLDYHQLLQQFNGFKMRVIFGVEDDKFLLVQEDSTTYKGYLLSNITMDDIAIFEDNLSPLRLELADKSERDSEVLIEAGYYISDIDRRIISIGVTATSVDMTLDVQYVGNAVTTLSASDITVTDDIEGELTYSLLLVGDIYQLSSFSAALTRGCISILDEVYIGSQRYTVEAAITVANWNLLSDDNFVTLSGDNFVFINS